MSTNRIHIHTQSRQLTILVPVKKNKKLLIGFFIAVLPWVLCLWLLIDHLYIPEMNFWHKMLFLLAVLCWSVIGGIGFTFLNFTLMGREKILINAQQILIEKPLVFYNRRNYYLVKDISNLRLGTEEYQVRKDGVWQKRNRSILLMEYPNKQVSFGRGTSFEEAEWILLKIAQSNLLPASVFAPTHLVAKPH
ncbi:MAG: hypothetical protein M9887_07735 [Chitinophagales bacterium]|nr:hypothetical protein [Chitinophagales bacterium]